MPNEQLNVTVTPALARYVRAKIKSGRFVDTSEVLREALRALQREEESQPEIVLTPEEEAAARLGVLRGLDDIRHGRYRVLDANGLNKLGRNIVARTGR
jgi:putative addiction module CopG family antidote